MVLSTLNSILMKTNKAIHLSQSNETLIAYLHDFFANRQEIVLAYLFGSLVGRSTGPVHDIDIAVLVSPDQLMKLDQTAPYGYMAQMNAELAHMARCDKIDLIILNHAPPVLLREVIGKGKVVYSVSEMERIKFEIAALKKYADTSHLRKIKRLHMKKRIAKGLTAYA
jgi:predicted nucleotidyltransferase